MTGWSRDKARRRLVATGKRSPGSRGQVAKRERKPRARKYAYDTLKVLEKVWAGSAGSTWPRRCRSSSTDWNTTTNSSTAGTAYGAAVRRELLSMSPASIDRYLKPVKATDQIGGVSTTKPSSLLRSSIRIGKAGDEVEAEPGVFEGDTVAHCGPTLTGEFARTVNLTDLHTGWVSPAPSVTMPAPTSWRLQIGGHRDHLRLHRSGLRQRIRVPQRGGHRLGRQTWDLLHPIPALQEERPSHHRVQEQPPGPQVRLLLRYDTTAECAALNRLWRLVNGRLNYLAPTKKPIRFGADRNGRRTRRYDKPQTPLDRLIAAKVLAPQQAAQLLEYRQSLNRAAIGRQIADLQKTLLNLAKDKTEQLYLASIPAPSPTSERASGSRHPEPPIRRHLDVRHYGPCGCDTRHLPRGRGRRVVGCLARLLSGRAWFRESRDATARRRGGYLARWQRMIIDRLP